MTKVVTIRAQQMWEFTSVNRKTEEFLIEELNDKGKAGWELVSVAYHKDLKGLGESFSWSAFMKRPLAPAVPGPAVSPAVASQPHPASGEPPASSSDSSTDIFEIRST